MNVIYRARPLELLVALLFFVIATLLLGLSLYQALRASGARVTLKRTIYAHVAGLLLSDFTPARSGYVSTAAFMKQSSDIPASQTLAAVFSVQSVSFAFKAAVIFLAIPYFLLKISLTMSLMYAIAVAGTISLLATALLAILVWSGRGVGWLDRLLARTYAIPFIGRATRLMTSLLKEIHVKGKLAKGRELAVVAVFAIASSIAFAIALYPIGLALEISNVPIYEWIILGPLVAALGFVPITPAGLGVQEATYVIILSLLGVPLSTAVAFSLIARFLYVLPDLAGLPIVLKAGTEYAWGLS